MTLGESILIGLNSEWVDQSEMRVRTRRITQESGTLERIMVDVIEMTEGDTSLIRSLDIARKYAALNGASDAGVFQVCDLQTDRKVIRLNDDRTDVHVRMVCWAFGMEDE